MKFLNSALLGALVVEILKQAQTVTYSFVDQALILFVLQENFLDPIPVPQARDFATQFVSYLKSVYLDVYNTLLKTADLTTADREKLKEIAKEFSMLFVPKK